MNEKNKIGVLNIDQIKFLMPVNIEFKPLPDITAFELAKILPLFFRAQIMPHDLPEEPELLRHLIINDPNK